MLPWAFLGEGGVLEGMEYVVEETLGTRGGGAGAEPPSRACPQLPNNILLEDSFSQVSILSKWLRAST